ncbi:MAG: hypothetical protein QGH33_04975, partial [Pirellulaceae bacterium]|nr:hypothetical protein [Pirellulaceae bacterium]
MANSDPLPSPTGLPNADLVIYDGHCRFCTDSVRRLHDLAGGAARLGLWTAAGKKQRFWRLTNACYARIEI